MSDVVFKIAYTDSCDLVALGSVERGTMIVTRERGSIVSVAVAPEDFGELITAARAVGRGEMVEPRFRRVEVERGRESVTIDGPRRWWPSADKGWAGRKV